jgi:transposase-like protein
MSTKTRYSAAEKATVALAAIKGQLIINEISQKHGVHSTQINR